MVSKTENRTTLPKLAHTLQEAGRQTSGKHNKNYRRIQNVLAQTLGKGFVHNPQLWCDSLNTLLGNGITESITEEDF